MKQFFMKHQKLCIIIGLSTVMMILVIGFASLVSPKEHSIDVKFIEWRYTIQIQELHAVQKSGRSKPPKEAYDITKTRKSERIHDGYDSQGNEKYHYKHYDYYEYTIDEYQNSRTVVTHGTDKNPYWGEVVLKESTDPRGLGQEREAGRTEQYTVNGTETGEEIISLDVSKDIWGEVTRGDEINYMKRIIGKPYNITIAK